MYVVKQQLDKYLKLVQFVFKNYFLSLFHLDLAEA